ncbi:siderophore-iron reductase FhuF [Pseudomonas gingeri]|uniref:Siderophore-iron reductase FhuF n=1 Tax=Pseudomonas gingeri TaxID=117681 RepID=A0A7Y7XK59_9PSED|nr:siderophore-iron reductase FhuF [Pseudomonas gingeri]NWC00349.1 siderophore-iron reductase FhuF [Pseudomonas gingeri]
MIASLAPLFSGPLLAYAEKLQPADNADAVSAQAFFRPESLNAFMDALQERHQADDRRALVSIWSKWYFSTFLAPVLAADLLLQRALPIALADVGLVLDANGKPSALTLPDAGQERQQACGFSRFASLIEGHLVPVIDAFASVCRASPRLFWSNAGNTFEFATSRIELHPLATPGCTASAHQVLGSRLRPDGERNPLFEPVTYRDIGESEPQRLRRICCIRYRLPGVGYCSSCPIEVSKRR